MDDWREEFRSGIANLVDRAVVSGARQADVFQADAEIRPGQKFNVLVDQDSVFPEPFRR